MEQSYAPSASERPLSEGVTSAHEPANGSGHPHSQRESSHREGNVNGAGISGGPPRAAAAPSRSPSDVFLLATFALALIAWLVALVSQAVVAATISDAPVRLLWFAIIIQTLTTALVALVILETPSYNAAYAYGTQISVFASIATVFAVVGVDANIYSHRAAQQATGAGWLLAAIVDLLWILFFTSPPQSPLFRLASSRQGGAGQGEEGEEGRAVQKIPRSTDAFVMSPLTAPDLLSRPVSGGGDNRATIASIPSEHRSASAVGSTGVRGQAVGSAAAPPSTRAPSDGTAPDSTARWRAEAMFDYNGSTDDPNELVFKKGDVLLVFDKSGKWWEAKKAGGGGQKGIAPSNYLRLM